MLKKLLISLGALVVLVVAGSYLLPGHYRVARSVDIDAPVARVFALVNDLNSWSRWTVWSRRDPDMRITITGGGVGTGAARSWESETQGRGRVIITESVPDRSITYELYFADWDSRSIGHFAFQAGPAGTRVTWVDQGDLGYNPVLRYFGLFFDAMMGADFEQGLARLKTLAESG